MKNKVEINNIQQLNDALNKYYIPFAILSDVDRKMLISNNNIDI
ncbi:hypothetical protein [Clostridioides difficile]|nr:hypothetical protein [Clostridioides difficile]